MKQLQSFIPEHKRLQSTLGTALAECRRSADYLQELAVHAENDLDEEFCHRSTYRLIRLEEAIEESLDDLRNHLARLEKMAASGSYDAAEEPSLADRLRSSMTHPIRASRAIIGPLNDRPVSSQVSG